MLDSIKIVLVGTSHPGNIGSAARAMKTMGLSKLVLVQPERYPHQQAIEMASGACDILEDAIIVDTLEQAVANCHLVVGSSARPREIQIPLLKMGDLGKKFFDSSDVKHSALVFGRERTGLTNQELSCCNYHIMIEANPSYSSLNLAQAVQIFCYELRKASLLTNNQLISGVATSKLAKRAEIESFYEHLKETLYQIDFLDPSQPKKVMPKLKRLFSRTQLEVSEVNILRGILSAAQKSARD